MPPTRKRLAKGGNETLGSGPNVDVEQQEQQQQQDSLEAPPNPPHPNRHHEHEANLTFWRDLGYYETHPNHGKRKFGSRSAALFVDGNDEGQVEEKYSLHINPSSKRVLLLQYPDRAFGNLYCEELKQKPTEIRIKPKSGVVEVDVPLPTAVNFDQERGIDFSLALEKNDRKDGAHGLAGGLGVGLTRPQRDADGLKDDVDKAELFNDFDNAVKSGHVMDKITLGGRIVPFRESDPIYMVATFNGTTCTWTRIDAIVQLRTQLHHLDALNEESQRTTARLDRKPGDQVKEDRVQDVNMVIKGTDDTEQADMYGGMTDTSRLLRNMRDEPWQRMKWIDSTDDGAYDAYDEILISDKPEAVPVLVSDTSNEQYLDAISCPREDPITQSRNASHSLDDSESSSEEESSSPSANAGEGRQDEEASQLNETGAVDAQPTYEVLPRGAMQPDGATERDIERICRLICLSPPLVSGKVEQKLKNRLKEKSRFGFLGPGHKFHSYYKWRLERNRLGDGIAPECDLEGGEGVHSDQNGT